MTDKEIYRIYLPTGGQVGYAIFFLWGLLGLIIAIFASAGTTTISGLYGALVWIGGMIFIGGAVAMSERRIERVGPHPLRAILPFVSTGEQPPIPAPAPAAAPPMASAPPDMPMPQASQISPPRAFPAPIPGYVKAAIIIGIPAIMLIILLIASTR